jgi:hypothetical protein
MWSRHWLKLTLVMTLVLAGLGVAANVSVDLYGLYRDPTGRHLPVYGDEGVAKYLLSTRYVHANFDGVLLGSSISANWPVGNLPGARLYNESLNGGNIVEEKALLDRLLERPGLKVAILVVHPYLTSSHAFNTVELKPREAWGALGSQNLLDAYKHLLKFRLHRDERLFDETGTADFKDRAQKLNNVLTKMMTPNTEFEVDPIARAAYRDAVLALHDRHIPVVFVVPPVSRPLFDGKPDAFAHYTREILAERTPADLVLDFTSPGMDELGRDPQNFTDGVHLRPTTAARLVAQISERMQGQLK